jgi:parafibromin
MSNIKSFLSDGIYVPPDHPTLATHTSSNILQIVRNIHTVTDPSKSASLSAAGTQSVNLSAARKPTRFILVDSTADFKPDYWNRLVAVFTTGQTWQFKSYKWSSAPELFKHATGIYVGWRGEDVPKEVKGWGRGVRSFAIDRWDEKSANLNGGTTAAGGGIAGPVGGSTRWRDLEVVEGIWTAIEEGMRARGWGTSK